MKRKIEFLDALILKRHKSLKRCAKSLGLALKAKSSLMKGAPPSDLEYKSDKILQGMHKGEMEAEENLKKMKRK